MNLGLRAWFDVPCDLDLIESVREIYYMIDDLMSRPIRNHQDVDFHLAHLLERDPRLQPVLRACGEVPLRILGDGFSGLVQIVVGQLLSVAAAKVIHERLVAYLGDVTPQNLLLAPDAELRALGLSFAKIRGLKSVAHEVVAGRFDLAGLGQLSGDLALKRLMGQKGIGRWTAEIYLISALGHPDYFPAGDLALRKIVGLVLQYQYVPSEGEVREIALQWSPHRAVAARLLWRYFAVLRDKEGVNL